MDAIFKLWKSPIAMGIAAAVVSYMVIDSQKPSLVYKDDKMTLQNDMLSPLTISAAVAIATGMYLNSKQPVDSGMMPASSFPSTM